jgi:hypothetical protein
MRGMRVASCSNITKIYILKILIDNPEIICYNRHVEYGCFRLYIDKAACCTCCGQYMMALLSRAEARLH